MSHQEDFMLAFRGSFTSTLRWHHLDALWEVLRLDADGGWYLYAIGEAPPATPVDKSMLLRFIDEIDKLLREEHGEDYCGIVYADDLVKPSLIKIYDPNNLGVSCGYSDNPPLPGWVLSKIQPVDLPATLVPNNRKRWWRRLFNK
ncbi:MAG: hypothetical protein KZQ80_02625 [Candidatus Thiodiazotropha sp. (ex Monitilora ramsayi)]|nr:hypothetical protein [Candidatus Thiodiazotropha sp. (ex Monitilora ramsayi)]